MQAFQQNLAKLEAADTQVLGISMDSSFSNKAWAQQINVTFPLLSDWGGDVTKAYGVYNPKYKAARRVNYLIDKDGMACCHRRGRTLRCTTAKPRPWPQSVRRFWP